MSESERMPGYLNRSHVPPLASRASSRATLLVGSCSRSWQAAPIPESPAPTISTSTCSGVVTDQNYPRHGVPWHPPTVGDRRRFGPGRAAPSDGKFHRVPEETAPDRLEFLTV